MAGHLAVRIVRARGLPPPLPGGEGKQPSIDDCISKLGELAHDHGAVEGARRWVEWLPASQARAFAAPFALQLARRLTAEEEGEPC